MKIIAIISAGLIGSAALMTPVVASAAPIDGIGEGQRTERTVVVQRSHTVRHGNGWGANRTRRVCKVTYRRGERIRRCRTVRVRY